MYGLPQPGFLANKLLNKRLSKHVYYPVQYTPELWKHTWHPVTVSLVVDGFGVKYTVKDHALHLINALENDYKLALGWQGKTYCGITLEWNYYELWVDLTMPGYIKNTGSSFNIKCQLNHLIPLTNTHPSCMGQKKNLYKPTHQKYYHKNKSNEFKTS